MKYTIKMKKTIIVPIHIDWSWNVIIWYNVKFHISETKVASNYNDCMVSLCVLMIPKTTEHVFINLKITNTICQQARRLQYRQSSLLESPCLFSASNTWINYRIGFCQSPIVNSILKSYSVINSNIVFVYRFCWGNELLW